MTDWVRKPSAIFPPVDQDPVQTEPGSKELPGGNQPSEKTPVDAQVAKANAAMDDADVRDGCLLARTKSGWLIHCRRSQQTVSAETEIAGLIDLVKEMLDRNGRGAMKCVIAVESADCFFVETKVPDSIDVRDRTAVSFELEHHFPLDAEAMASDYSVTNAAAASEQRIAALAVDVDRLMPLTKGLEEQGIQSVLIAPWSFLIARAAMERRGMDSAVDIWFLEDDHCESLRSDGDGIRRWKQFPDGEDGLQSDHAVSSASGEPVLPIVVIGQDASTFQTFRVSSFANVDHFEKDTIGLVAEGASIALSGRWGKWLDLRRGALTPTDPLFAVAQPLRWLAFAAALCFLICSLAAWYRAERVTAEVGNVLQQQRDAFQDAFPGRRVPTALKQSVSREHRKVLGSRGAGDEVDVPVPATEVLSHLYRGFAKARQEQKLRFRLIDLNIISGEVSLTVRVRETAQVVALTKALENAGFDVSPPATDQIDPTKDENVVTYQSTITAVWRSSIAAPEQAR